MTIVLAERAFNRDRVGLFKLFWFATIVLAGLFLTMTVVEWRKLIYQKGLTISTNLFGTTFYSLVGCMPVMSSSGCVFCYWYSSLVCAGS